MKKKEVSILIKQGRKTLSILKSPNLIKQSSGWAYLSALCLANDIIPIFLACK